MPQTCTVCRSPRRDEVDRALLAGEPSRRISARCAVSATAVRRHAAHVPKALALAARASEVTRADDLLGVLHECAADARRIRDKAEREGDLKCAIVAVKTLTDIVDRLVDVGERLAAQGQGEARPPIKVTLRLPPAPSFA